jgi:hypothetical protein
MRKIYCSIGTGAREGAYQSRIIINSILLDADLGYQGREPCHANRFIAVKGSKNQQLSRREKAYNQGLSHRRKKGECSV